MNKNLDVTFDQFVIDEHGLYATCTCGKKTAQVCITDLEVRIVCQNASHRAWNGFGRGFESITVALEAYKSPEMKAILKAVDARNS